MGYGLCVTPDFGFRMLNFRFFDFTLWTLSFDLWILDSGLGVLEFKSRFPHSPKSKVLGLWTLGFGSWPLGYGLCVTPDFGFRIFEL